MLFVDVHPDAQFESRDAIEFVGLVRPNVPIPTEIGSTLFSSVQKTGRSRQRPNYRFHDGGTYAVPEDLDLVPACSMGQLVVAAESHGPLQLRHLEHSQHGSPPLPSDQTKSIKGSKRPQRAVERLPSATSV
jgi:hypothetical protein